MRPDGPRDPIVGPDSGPEPPFPLKLNGEVVKGFGRGSKEVSITCPKTPYPQTQKETISKRDTKKQ